MKKIASILLPVLAFSAVGCSGGSSDDAPPAKGNMPNIETPPPGMTGPGQRTLDDTGEGTR